KFVHTAIVDDERSAHPPLVLWPPMRLEISCGWFCRRPRHTHTPTSTSLSRPRTQSSGLTAARRSLTVWWVTNDNDNVAKASWLAYDRVTPVGELQGQIEGVYEITVNPSYRAKIETYLSAMKE